MDTTIIEVRINDGVQLQYIIILYLHTMVTNIWSLFSPHAVILVQMAKAYIVTLQIPRRVMEVATILCILIIRNRKDVMKQSKNRRKDRKIERNSYMTYIYLF